MGQKYMRHMRGFTLVEVLVVIALIGTMATVVITLINPVQQFRRGRDTQRKAAMRQIQTALELYRADQGAYPNALPACSTALTSGGVTYIQKVPCDPRNTGQYTFHYTSAGPTYTLIACLENVNDPEKDATNASATCTGGTTNRSYTLTNP